MVGYEWGAVSDRGDIRKENQDHILCLMGEILGTPAALFAVADGMWFCSFLAGGGRTFNRWCSLERTARRTSATFSTR